jgi:hypothetical protein
MLKMICSLREKMKRGKDCKYGVENLVDYDHLTNRED